MSIIAMRHSLMLRKADDRETWDKHIEYLLSLMGYCVGFGNVWRFPYLAYNNGGATFLFPYVILMVLVGKPLIFLESSLGQFLSLGPVAAFGMIPICKGIGAGMVLLAWYFSLYYIMYMVYVTKFIYYSFSATLPWMECGVWWGADERCFLRGSGPMLPLCRNATNETLSDSGKSSGRNKSNNTLDALAVNCTMFKQETATSQFWNKYILHRTRESSMDNLGSFLPDLCLLLLLNWAIVCLCLVRGIKSSGKVVYFTALFPYVVLLLMGVIGCTLDGAWTGLYYLFLPSEAYFLQDILKLEVWKQAVTQLFFSLGLGIGGIIMCSSYNRFDNKVLSDAIIISSIDFLTSIIASITVFSTLGFLAYELGVDVKDVVREGPGLMFVVIPEAIGMMPIPQIWSVLFFLMIYTLGLDSEFVLLEIVLTTMKDEVAFIRKHKVMCAVFVCLICFGFGLPFCQQGGYHLVDMYDTYAVNIGLLFGAFTSLAVICYWYSLQRFSEDLQFMLGFHPKWYYWKLCWALIDPIILLFLFTTGVWSMGNHGYDKKEYSEEWRYFKWFLAWSPISLTPILAFYMLMHYKNKTGTFKAAFKIPPNWGPRDPLTNALYQDWLKQRALHNQMKPPNPLKRLYLRLKHRGRQPPIQADQVESGESMETIHVENIR